MRATLQVWRSAVQRRASARRCAACALARQTRTLEPNASGCTVRHVKRRPALALTWQPALAAAPRRAGAFLRAASRRAGIREAVPSGWRKKQASRRATLSARSAAEPAYGARPTARLPSRPRALTLQTRAAGRLHGIDGGGEVRSAQRARLHAANELLSLPHAGAWRSVVPRRPRVDARCATRAQVLQRSAARWRCARCSAAALRAALGTRAPDALSGCVVAARSAPTDAQHAMRYDAQVFTSVVHRAVAHDTLLGCAVRLRAAGLNSDGCCGWAPSLTGLPCAAKARS